ncbi:MAG: inositol monophosphatase [Roseibacillus sp.]|jgi:myo-inositol-1(or 4)-monophosphatase|nr:inositol monophosphatase [Roseibacillus sp.]MBP34166.1 inositol monophosphatase [Roseibacillus sp.]MCP4731326.1 inositol monophosphatase [Roseibacillus sp.]MDP6208867.1 inositol monophosphatase family protein [Roseibacillus sp.]MDP7306064.1 inositol monophosphatase family protein [Roseibacillus sp.]|tara:strand:+ start:18601 stop:19356 length:756 start_codon:yes stop_codon:yes gene_type:complete
MTHLQAAEQAAHQAGALLRENFHRSKDIDEAYHHDVKLALDRKSQDLITKILLDAFPEYALYGEEGIAGNQNASLQWIVDPIDGTVNYLYSIPHFCISIALRERDREEIVMGLIYDPMLDELWTVEKGGAPFLNGKPIACSQRTTLEESILFVGCGKDEESMATGLERFERASTRARKMRMMGSAALGMAYIATGRLDAYIESRISLWDVAAGILLVESGGGKVDLTPHPTTPDVWSVVATNGKIPIEEIL